MTKDEFISRHSGLVYDTANKLGVGNNPDAIQEGFYGLIKAAQSYDSSRGIAFSTYAVPTIKGYILKSLHEDKIIPDKRVDGKNYSSAGVVDSLDRTIGNNDEDGMTVLNRHIVDDSESVIRRIDLERALDKLTEDQKIVWDLKLKGLTESEISKRIGKSQPHVSRLIRKACMTIARWYYDNR